MLSDDDMASGSMDHVDRDDDYRLILLTAKYIDTYIHMCDNIINEDSMYIMYTYLAIIS